MKAAFIPPLRMKAGGEGRQEGAEEEELVDKRGRTKKESRQRGRGGAEMKSARSHLSFVNRWVEVSDCDESRPRVEHIHTHTGTLLEKMEYFTCLDARFPLTVAL